MSLYHVILNSSSPRFDAWQKIFDGEEIPLQSCWSGPTDLGPEKGVRVYVLDIPRLTAGQRDRLVQWTAEKFGVAPVLIEEQLDSIGFPIRECDVIVAFSLRAFI
jgi:hypothetical protein